jgi:hypothetical protein
MAKTACMVLLLVLMTIFASPSGSDLGATIDGDRIFFHGNPFAELRYLRSVTSAKGRHLYRGLAIYYYPSNKEVWIFPEQGWKIIGGGKEQYSIQEIENAWGTRGLGGLLFNNKRVEKNEAIHAWCFDVKISDDARYVYYKTKGWLFESSHKYAIEYPDTDTKTNQEGAPPTPR